jgi:SAM-dependent methyltransferase
MIESGARLVYEGRDLEAMSFAQRYHRWILNEFEPYLGSVTAEAGAGSGNFSEILLSAPIKQLIAAEPSHEMFPVLESRFGGDRRVVPLQSFFKAVSEQHVGQLDSAVYVNVLEHVPDDEQELSWVWSSLRPGGYVCIFVPALSWLYSDFDREIGHYRRYHKGPLRHLLQRTGFETVRLRYFDIAGIAPWYVNFVLLKRSLTASNVALYDRWVVPALRKVESILPVPLGKNLLAVGRKPLGGS